MCGKGMLAKTTLTTIMNTQEKMEEGKRRSETKNIE